jgi:hypothetical protein
MIEFACFIIVAWFALWAFAMAWALLHLAIERLLDLFGL